MRILLIFAMCLICGYSFNAYSANFDENVQYGIKYDENKAIQDVKANKKYKNKIRKKEKKHIDLNNWHGAKNNKNIKMRRKYSRFEIAEAELNHYERFQQNFANAIQKRNYRERRLQRIEKYNTKKNIKKYKIKKELEKNEEIQNNKVLDKVDDYVKDKKNAGKINNEYTREIIMEADDGEVDKDDEEEDLKEDDKEAIIADDIEE